MKIFLVGGAVRDSLMGIKPKDLDYVMVLDNIQDMTVEQGFDIMKKYMEDEGFTIWLSTPEMYTIRAKFPAHYTQKGDADFVLARKEVGYIEGTRRPKLELGTLEDDLLRRDFTINAMAEDENGNIIDLFGGELALKTKILVTPLPADITFADDPLRMIRALRFSITKEMSMSNGVRKAMSNTTTIQKFREVVSQERVREEIFKMFKHDTISTMHMLIQADNSYFPGVMDICFGGEMWLKPTTEK